MTNKRWSITWPIKCKPRMAQFSRDCVIRVRFFGIISIMHLHICSCILLISNQITFLVQFGISTRQFFQRLQIALALRALFTRAHLVQTALEIMWLSIRMLPAFIYSTLTKQTQTPKQMPHHLTKISTKISNWPSVCCWGHLKQSEWPIKNKYYLLKLFQFF